MKLKNPIYFWITLCVLSGHSLWADSKPASSEDSLYRQSIQHDKQSIARETLDVFYHDALDCMHDNRNDEALELLDKIYSIDPTYEDVAKLRNSIRKSQAEQAMGSIQDSVHQLMKKGNKASDNGQPILAISFWRQALALDPTNTAAKKKIDDVNKILAQKQFETGYIHYHHGEMEEALDAWSNAVALDPSLKQRGLLLLMSKVDRKLQQDQISRLAAQGFDQYQQGNSEGALKTYSDLLAVDPRNEEAKRMAAKIKIQLGRVAFADAAKALAAAHDDEAIAEWQKSIQYDYEVQRSQKSIADLQARRKREIENALAAKRKPKHAPTVAASTSTAVSSSTVVAAPAQAVDPAGAMDHYRQGLAAIRGKDYHQAVTELDTAYQLDATNERIYMARERAHQEWAAVSSGNSGVSTP